MNIEITVKSFDAFANFTRVSSWNRLPFGVFFAVQNADVDHLLL